MTTRPTTTARRSIREDLDQTLFVEAGAGSGKTTSLVDRVVVGGADATACRCAQIAAVTFTEKAAAELRDRLRARVRRADRDRPPQDGARRPRRRRDRHPALVRAADPHRASDRGRAAAADRGAGRGRLRRARSTTGGRRCARSCSTTRRSPTPLLLAMAGGVQPRRPARDGVDVQRELGPARVAGARRAGAGPAAVPTSPTMVARGAPAGGARRAVHRRRATSCCRTWPRSATGPISCTARRTTPRGWPCWARP